MRLAALGLSLCLGMALGLPSAAWAKDHHHHGGGCNAGYGACGGGPYAYGWVPAGHSPYPYGYTAPRPYGYAAPRRVADCDRRGPAAWPGTYGYGRGYREANWRPFWLGGR
jgi:hypothetical protein